MPAPAILVIAPVVAAAVSLFLRRWPLASALFGAVVAIILASYAAQVDTVITGGRLSDQSPGGAWVIYGRPLILGYSVQIALTLSYVLLAILFVLTLVTTQSNNFVPVGIAMMSPIAALLMAQPIIIGAILLLVVASMQVVVIQGERFGSTISSVRHLSMAALAVPPLLLAGWILDTDQTQLLPIAILLILGAILILMSAFPFQFWVSPAVSEAGSLVPAVIFGIVNLLVAAFILKLLVTNPVIYGNIQFLRIIGISGVATLMLASLLVLAAHSFGRLLGYLLLLDIGATTLALSVGGRAALETVLSFLILRTIGLTLAGVGFGLIRRQLTEGEEITVNYSGIKSLARRTPFGVMLFIYGGLSLAGAPLTPGFVGRWLLVTMPLPIPPIFRVLLILSVAAGTAGLIRVLIVTLSLEHKTDKVVTAESNVVKIAAVLLLAAGIMLSVVPQLLLFNVSAMTNLF